MDKISIIVAFRNRDLLRVKRFLNSLNTQTNKEFEVVFVNTGSELEFSKSLKEVVESYDFTTYIYHDTRGKEWNKCVALNIAAKHAKGNYLGFTDIDLMYHSGYIEHLYPLLNEKAQLYTRVHMVDQSFTDYDRVFESGEEVPGTLCHTSGKGILMVHREAYEAIGGYDEYYVDWGIEDNDIFIRLQEYGLNEVWADHVKHPVYHQWHPTNARFHIYPEKWLDDMSFYYIENQKNYLRNQDIEPGTLVKTEERSLLTAIKTDEVSTVIEVDKTGTVSTKTMFYRQIWDELNSNGELYFKVVVPNFEIPKMSFVQTSLAKVFGSILNFVKSPFTVVYREKFERHVYFIPEIDIKWYFRKLLKSTNLIADYYIQEDKNQTIYYLQKKR